MKYCLSLLFSLFFIGLQAQKLEDALLWKISGNGIKKPSYLYGTIHASCDTLVDQNVIQAMKKTEQLYLEIDVDDPKMESQMMANMNMKNGVTMESLVSAEDYKIVDDFLRDNAAISAKTINTIKPSFVSIMFVQKILSCKPKSVEESLAEISKSQNEAIYGLETVAEQMKVFDKISYQEQMDELVRTAKNGIKTYEEDFNKLMQLYKDKKINDLLNFTNELGETASSKFDDEMLVNRNAKWIPIIADVARFKPTFFGVGAAHLAGENGVILLLRKQGFTVEAVK
ncbi:TraB family protein [compost metagenome]